MRDQIMVRFLQLLYSGWRLYQYNEDNVQFQFYLYKSFRQHECTKIWKKEKLLIKKSFSLITCKLVIRKIDLDGPVHQLNTVAVIKPGFPTVFSPPTLIRACVLSSAI